MPDIRKVPLAELKGDDRNPKSHDLAGTISSLRRFGFVDPVVQDQRTKLLVAGHGRVAALRVMRERGEDPPGGIEPDGWKVPTYTGWSSDDDDEADAALVALNRLTEVGGWDVEQLVDLLTAVSKSAREGLAGVGYDGADLDNLRSKLGMIGDDTERLAEEQDLRPFDRTYFLVAAPLDQHGAVWEILNQLDNLEGVDVATSQG